MPITTEKDRYPLYPCRCGRTPQIVDHTDYELDGCDFEVVCACGHRLRGKPDVPWEGVPRYAIRERWNHSSFAVPPTPLLREMHGLLNSRSACPETRLLLDLALRAQETGTMPNLGALTSH